MSSSHRPHVRYASSKTKAAAVGSLAFDGDNGSMASAVEVLHMKIDDISTADTEYVVAPVAGDIIACRSVVYGTLATAASVLSFTIGGVAVTGGDITVATGGAAGDVDSSAPTAANTVAVGDYVSCTTSGASTNAHPVAVEVVIQRSS